MSPPNPVNDDVEMPEGERGAELAQAQAEPGRTASANRNIFEIIKADHQNVKELFEQIEAAVEGEEKTHLIERCIQELLLHAVSEEETLYKRLRDSEDLREDILEAEVEHSLLERLANEIMSASPDDEMCDARLMVLKELVEHHVEEEEEELIPAAQSVIDAATAESLGEEMLARKAALEAEGLALEDDDALFDEELDDGDDAAPAGR
jgi:hemerythrin superfamily protein